MSDILKIDGFDWISKKVALAKIGDE